MRRLGSVSICLMAMFGLSPARADLVDFIVNAGANLAAFIGQPIIFAGSAADPDNGIASVQWDFNYDGSNFDADPSANGTLMPLHTYGAPGTYQVALDATDNGGMSEIGTLTVTVTQAQSFVVEAGPSRSGSVGAPILFAGFAADPSSGISSIQWDFNYDGTHFVPTPSANGQLTPSNIYNTPGTYEVAVEATDGLGVSEIGTTTVVVTATPEPSFLRLSAVLLSVVILLYELRTRARPVSRSLRAREIPRPLWRTHFGCRVATRRDT